MSILQVYNSVQKAKQTDFNAQAHLKFVTRIAMSLKNRIPPSLCVDDLIQVGLIALLDIYEKYDETQEKSFENFSSQRVRGAMIDLIRENTPLSKEKMALIRSANKWIDEYYIKNGYKPKESVVADQLGITLEKYQSLILEYESIFSVEIGSLEVHDPNILSPENFHDEQSTKEILIDAIKKLSEKEQRIIALYYLEELTQSEIAQVLSLTESRVSQLLKASLVSLRKLFHDLSGVHEAQQLI